MASSFNLLLPFLTLSVFLHHSLSLTQDGIFLLSFKYNIITDPLSLLQNWNYSDPNPCLWTGVTCNRTRVISLSLPSSNLLGSLSSQLFLIDQLKHLNLSNNSFNGSLPHTLFNSSNLLNLSLSHNNFSGVLSRGFRSVEFLDLSSNLFNGSLPEGVGGEALKYMNLSNNEFSGELGSGFGENWDAKNVTIDLSYNNLTGRIPGSKALAGQKPEAFVGNLDLCGKPLNETCVIPSTLSSPPNVTSISPAIAVIPRPVNDGNSSGKPTSKSAEGDGRDVGMKSVTIVGITMADLVGIALLALALFYLYQWRKRRAENCLSEKGGRFAAKGPDPEAAKTACCCIKGPDTEAETTDGRTSSDDENNTEEREPANASGVGRLVMLDGETEMEMETLMKASAYILGASGASIVYKAVLQDGTTFAVRRLGEVAGGERLKKENFESQVRAVAKMRHPNVVRVRGFYYGSTEKLVISDYVANGSLAQASSSCYKKTSSSPCHLSLEARLKIARGVARGLIYIHDKKFVHANLKPSNILLTQEMEPVIGDLGINWIIHGCKGNGSGRQFGSKRAMAQYDSAQDQSISGSSPYISPLGSANGPSSPYQAPELLRNLRPSPKWDVYSFGVILLELLTGKVGPDTPSCGTEDKWVLRMADVAIRADVQGREEEVIGVFKLGFQCASLVAHKRPSMKEALQVIEKVPVSSW